MTERLNIGDVIRTAENNRHDVINGELPFQASKLCFTKTTRETNMSSAIEQCKPFSSSPISAIAVDARSSIVVIHQPIFLMRNSVLTIRLSYLIAMCDSVSTLPRSYLIGMSGTIFMTRY